ncbi:MAG TPA: retropepsin-like aspartic protease [Thermoanaerobaculia bacterium]|nr:retropepsin-like aspartic protease [Thermoanaerobaculia bacterium]
MQTILQALLASVLLISTVPARRDGKMFYVPVRIAGHGPYWFCFDTGAHHVILDPTLVKELGLKSLGKTTTKGAGEGDVAVERLAPFDMTVGTAKLHVDQPWIIDLSGVPIPKWCRGIIGAQLLEAYATELNPERSTLRLFDRRTFTKPAGATLLPLEDKDHRLFMNVTIDVNDELTVQRRIRVDTGSEDSVGDESVKQARNVRESALGNGLGSDYTAVSGIFKAVHIGPFTIKDVWGPSPHVPVIGMEMFRRFTTTWDIAHNAMYLQPNGHLHDAVPAPPR